MFAIVSRASADVRHSLPAKFGNPAACFLTASLLCRKLDRKGTGRQLKQFKVVLRATENGRMLPSRCGPQSNSRRRRQALINDCPGGTASVGRAAFIARMIANECARNPDKGDSSGESRRLLLHNLNNGQLKSRKLYCDNRTVHAGRGDDEQPTTWRVAGRLMVCGRCTLCIVGVLCVGWF